VDFANTAANLRRTDRLLKQVEDRLLLIKLRRGERLVGLLWR
jgi:hypothetical protein